MQVTKQVNLSADQCKSVESIVLKGIRTEANDGVPTVEVDDQCMSALQTVNSIAQAAFKLGVEEGRKDEK